MKVFKKNYDASFRWWSRLKIKGDFVEIEDPDSRRRLPMPPVDELYRLAFRCLLDNMRSAPLPPHEYENLYNQLNLEKLYLDATRGGKDAPPAVCHVCFEFLTGRQSAYCSDRCRNAAKLRRGRNAHPERKLKRS
jgi:hypothetical protein